MFRFSLSCVLILFAATLVSAKEDPPNLIAGKQVPKDAKLQKGDVLVGIYEKKNYRVEIRDVKSGGKVRIRWVASGEDTDDVPQTDLYYEGDATPTRKAGKSPLPEAYQKYDKNKDGQIGLYEWDRAKYAEFRKLDKNKDGFLTPQELTGKSTVVASKTESKSSKTGDSKGSSETTELPNSGNLVEYEEKMDMSFVFMVTGKTGGEVWGAGPYSVDSDLATAAVHAGLLKDGGMGLVKVTITNAGDHFDSSEMNGVTTMKREEDGPAYTIEMVRGE